MDYMRTPFSGVGLISDSVYTLFAESAQVDGHMPHPYN